MLYFLFLLILLTASRQDWLTNCFNSDGFLVFFIILLPFHPNIILSVILYLLFIFLNTFLKETYIGNGDIDILWLGSLILSLENWYFWLLFACSIHFILEKFGVFQNTPAPFVPSITLSWIIVNYDNILLTL